MKTLENLRTWLCRTALHVITPIDYSLRVGDIVQSRYSGYDNMEIVGINWALSSVAVLLNRENPKSLTVWGVWSVIKKESVG